MATTQMNIRFEESLKADGTAAFARCGYTPSQVVHAVWAFAQRNAGNAEAIRAMMTAICDTAPGAKRFVPLGSGVAEDVKKSEAVKRSEELRARRREMIGAGSKAQAGEYGDETSYEEALQNQIEKDNALRAAMMLQDLQEGA